MAAPAPPQDFVGAMAQTQDPLSKARRTGSESGACPQGDRHRPKGLVERRRLAHARRHYQSVTGAMGPPELARSDSGPVAALLNRRVRSRTHGGVGDGKGDLPSHTIITHQSRAVVFLSDGCPLAHASLVIMSSKIAESSFFPYPTASPRSKKLYILKIGSTGPAYSEAKSSFFRVSQWSFKQIFIEQANRKILTSGFLP